MSLSVRYESLCLGNAWTYFGKNHHNYSAPDPLDSDDIFKVMGSKVKVRLNGHRNLVNSIAYELPKGLEPKFTQILTTL